MNLALLAMKGREAMTKTAESGRSARTVGYDYMLNPGRPLDLGIGAERSGESSRALALSLNTGPAAYRGALTGAAFTALTGVPAYKLLTSKGRTKAKASLKHDQLLLNKAMKNLSSPTAITGIQKAVDSTKNVNLMNKLLSKQPDPVKELSKNRSIRKAQNALRQIGKKRNLRRIGLGGLAGAGLQTAVNSLGNLIAYETGRGLAPVGPKVKPVKQPTKK